MKPNPVKTTGLHCPECGSIRLSTLDTRSRGETTRRRKKCRACGTAFYTREFPETMIPDDERLDRIFGTTEAK
jgi:transcriptional regulator NrdR family protein